MHVSVNAQNDKSSPAMDLAEYGAWVISDVSGLRQRLLQVQQLGPVVAVFHDLHTCQNNLQSISLVCCGFASPDHPAEVGIREMKTEPLSLSD